MQPRNNALGSPDDVEIMDLTESISQMGSPTPAMIAGRKRKSSELEPHVPHKQCPQHGERRQERSMGLPHASQQSFTAIDEIMDQPPEPPPPYSTIPPNVVLPVGRPSAGSSSTLSNGPPRVMEDSDEDDDDKIVNFTGSRSKTRSRQNGIPESRRLATTRRRHIANDNEAPDHLNMSRDSRPPSIARQSDDSKPRGEREAKPQQQNVYIAGMQESPNADSESMRRFFAVPESEIDKVYKHLDLRKETVCDMIAQWMDEDQNTAELDKELDELDQRYEALKTLTATREDYQNLSAEREQLLAALKHAIKARQNRTEANEALKACKDKIQKLENHCLSLLPLCKSDVEALLGTLEQASITGDARLIAVQSTQAPTFTLDSKEPAVPSSSRVAQTQVVRHDCPEYCRHTTRMSISPKDEISPSNIEAYFSPPKQKTAKSTMNEGRAQPVYDRAAQDEMFDDSFHDLNDEDIFTGTNALFSNRMGTPPAPLDPEDEDDFGMGNDDEMLEFAEDIENGLQPARPSHRSASRPVFAETSGNSRSKVFNASAKKTKRTPAKVANADLEALFRFKWSHDVMSALKGRFGLRGFRPNQVEAINATLSGKDTFVLMPTGGGKSLCYQLPSIISSGETRGVTIVISPLLSLMEDQVQHLRKLSIQAFLLNGETSRDEKTAINEALREHKVEDFVQLLYVTPEMLSKNQFMVDTFERLYQRQKLARLVIDEAHCVSQWGHDFRPDYKLLGDVRRKFPKVPVMALTATATENVKLDVIHNLAIDGCDVFTQSFNRPNLYYEVRPKGKKKDDIQNIANLIKERHAKQTGIVYCLSRKTCEEMAEALRKEHKIKAHHYHAKMEPKEKQEVQKSWQAGKYHVIVATIAFGMGIDKADVRFVVHHSIPKSLEGYYQETGRAGRDQDESGCYLFYGYQDAGTLRRMIDDGEGSREQKERQHLMLRKMVQYCENNSDCRRVQVLSYFNENFRPDDCDGMCDNCNSTSTFENVDFTDYAQQAINLVRQVASIKVTVHQCMEVFRGASTKITQKITDSADQEVTEYGSGKDLDRGDVERLFSGLLSEDAIRENHVQNKMGFFNQYVALGGNCRQYQSGRERFYLQIRSSPRTKAKAPAKKKAPQGAREERNKRRKGVAGSVAPPELPLSTNVSSPIQAASTRKKAKQPARRDGLANGYEHDDFVVSDPEDDFAGTEDESSDAFEPIRVAGQPRKEKVRELGGPITTDEVMDHLDEIHRMLVESFVDSAKEKAKDIMLNKSLRTVPFTNTILRHMFIYFTETEEQMLTIPGINPEKVQLYGKHFCKLVRDCRRSYDEMMAESEGRPDPNAQNVIDLVSDDDEEDDYGSLDPSDFEGEEDVGEPSAYFQPNAKVEAFNARFVNSQSQGQRAAASSQPAKPKGKKRNWKATESTGMGNRRRFSGGSRKPSTGFNGAATASRVTKKRAPGKRSSGSGVRRSNSMATNVRNAPKTGRGGGISMMPT